MGIGKKFQSDFSEMEQKIGREKLLELIDSLPAYRDLLLEALNGSERTFTQIASELNISRGRVGQKAAVGVHRLRRKVEAVLKYREFQLLLPDQKEGTLNLTLELMNLSIRATNSLFAANIKTVRELTTRTELELLQFHNFGKKSLDEIKFFLAEHGLWLGMTHD